jgi:hypothetical protein
VILGHFGIISDLEVASPHRENETSDIKAIERKVCLKAILNIIIKFTHKGNSSSSIVLALLIHVVLCAHAAIQVRSRIEYILFDHSTYLIVFAQRIEFLYKVPSCFYRPESHTSKDPHENCEWVKPSRQENSLPICEAQG